MSAPLRAAIISAGLILIVSVAMAVVVLINYGGNSVVFAHTGTLFTNRTAAVPDARVTVGYDGQFVYYIARDGLQAAPLIDGLSFRYQRILLPAAARALSFGQAALVPWVILIINILAHSTGSGLVAYLVAGYGASGLLAGLTYGFWIGSLMIVRLDLTEGLCFTLALLAILAYQKRHYRWTVFLLMLATLSKEIGLVFAAGLALHAFFERRRGWAILIVGAPILQLLSWWGVLWMLFNELPTRYGAARLQWIPFRGLVLAERPLPETLMLVFWLAIPTSILFLLAVYQIYRIRHLTLTTALMLPAAGFVFAIPSATWFDSVAAYRVGMPIIIAGLLFMAEYYPQRIIWLASIWLSSLSLLLLLSELWLGGA
ncbi:MAG: hypothetical protein H7X77_05725 [Anaerolineae bacterium]|nr:hypothetical protein [Anaerolineae bacterium]